MTEERPKTDCKGCQSRDEILRTFALHIDEQNERIAELEKELANKQSKSLELAA